MQATTNVRLRSNAPSPELLRSGAPSPETRRSRAPSPETRRSGAPSPEMRRSRAPSPETRRSRAPSLQTPSSGDTSKPHTEIIIPSLLERLARLKRTRRSSDVESLEIEEDSSSESSDESEDEYIPPHKLQRTQRSSSRQCKHYLMIACVLLEGSEATLTTEEGLLGSVQLYPLL
ncbi:hypothetical protein EDD22DRAFT_959497 [Suillus occidentalis]|nr:hypothetical protein EDD22DRAFT_959497 [Suillus occidentalis]